MVNFNMIFIALLYDLGLDLDRGVVGMCSTIQAIFVSCVICMLTIMVVHNNKNALPLLGVLTTINHCKH
jgi:hypothetical protein